MRIKLFFRKIKQQNTSTYSIVQCNSFVHRTEEKKDKSLLELKRVIIISV